MEGLLEQKRERFAPKGAIPAHDHNLIEELRTCLATVWRYGECIRNAEGDAVSQQIWRELREQELVNVRQLKQLIVRRVERGEFLNDL